MVLSSATEDTALPAGTTVASFTDSNTSDTASGFSATITWGDGSSSAGMVSGANGSFTVTGGHTYADEGSYALSTAITRTADNTTITPTGTLTAAEADALTPHAATITGTASQALSNVDGGDLHRQRHGERWLATSPPPSTGATAPPQPAR